MKKHYNVGKSNPNYKDGKNRKINYCTDCGKKISSKCNKRCLKCYGKYRSIKFKGLNASNYKDGRCLQKNDCVDCGTNIDWRASRCNSCYGKVLGKRQEGRNNPSYIDGKSYEPYSKEFTESLKEQIRKRDNYECQNCGITEEEHIIVIGRVLEVHHIDYNKKNCQKNNLVTLCKQCNLRVNSNRNYWETYYKLKMEKIKCGEL